MLPFFLFLPVAQLPPTPLPPTPQPQEIRPPSQKPPRPVVLPDEVAPRLEEMIVPDLLHSKEVLQLQEIRPLPGTLDEVPVLNSNSPEVVQGEGILVSTFPPEGKQNPRAHLNYAFKDRFDLFAHHIARARTIDQTRTLFFGVLVYNPNPEPVTLDVLQAASYLTRPDALFVDLPPILEDPIGRVFSGPGSRVVNDILRGRRQGNWPPVLIIPPGQSQMLINLPIPVGNVVPSSNGRSTLLRLRSSNSVYIATLAMYAPQEANGDERIPTLEEWQKLLVEGSLIYPRDRTPTPPDSVAPRLIYGRVAGVSQGSQWKAQLTDTPNVDYLSIPQPGKSFSYVLSSLSRGTLGTKQVQSAPMLVRYPDTAYFANGNYGVQYSLTLPLYNSTRQNQTIAISLQTPLKEEQIEGGIRFLATPDFSVFFRGTVRIRYPDNTGLPQTRFIHLVQRRGQQGEPLVTLAVPPGERRLVEFDFLYPPDATPPQVLTIQTIKTGQ